MHLAASLAVRAAVLCSAALACLALTAEAGADSSSRALRSSARDQLFSQMESAAAAGDLSLAEAVQKQLLKISHREHRHRRSLLAPAPIEVDCEALAGEGLQGCADWQCRSTNVLVKNADGSVSCKFTAAAPPGVTFQLFQDVYGLSYDYDKLWTTDNNNVVAAASASGSTTFNTNANTRNGQWGARSTYADANNRVIVPNPFYGALANDQTNVNLFTTSAEIAQAATTPFTFTDTTSTGFDTGATVGAYLPGTTSTPREVSNDGKGSEDNLLVTTRNSAPFLGYWFGRRH